ncbi:AMP-binding protein, partial [Streptomyces sp. NPDC127110]|uniref:AMP-binding protein n=1 Tax=Streptomyces sp. NPDC127110 TaxID=3345362 RepID=UPI0036361149
MTQSPQSSQPDHTARQGAGTVLDRFAEWARRTPRAPALITGDETVPYAVLDAESDRLARQLTDSDLPAHGLVALALPRQRELVTALLAVLKAGGVYTVLDIADPRGGRRQLAALAPDLLIAGPADAARLDAGKGLRVLHPGEAADGTAPPPPPPPPPAPGHGRAAVLFTGSATPRPVPVGHALLLAAHEGWAETARLAPGDRHLFTAGPDTTPFAAGWTRALCSGGALVLPETAVWLPGHARRAVRKAEVSVVHTDPAGAADLLLADEPPASDIAPFRREPDAELRSLRLLAVSGDRLYLDEHSALQDRLRPGARVLNVYALTEAAGTGAWFELPQLPRPLDGPERISLLGTPFPGCRVRVLDGQLTVDPPGGGEAIATGDLGVLRPDGLLEFGGRGPPRMGARAGARFAPHPRGGALRGPAAGGPARGARAGAPAPSAPPPPNAPPPRPRPPRRPPPAPTPPPAATSWSP